MILRKIGESVWLHDGGHFGKMVHMKSDGFFVVAILDYRASGDGSNAVRNTRVVVNTNAKVVVNEPESLRGW